MRFRFFTVVAMILLFGSQLFAEAPASVPELVKQLGNPKFAVREMAHKELLKRGEGIAPELEKLTKTADAEMADRLRKILYELVGYKQTILRLLSEMEEDNAPISSELHGLVAAHQPGAGNFLMSLPYEPTASLKHRALRAFITAWDSAMPDQIESYVRKAVSVNTTHRPKFPAKVGAMISFETQINTGWTGWPPYEKKLDFRTRTTRYLDGKPYEKPFEYPYPSATVGWIRLGELAEGVHTIHAIMEYEFTQKGQKRKGEIRSKDSHFEVVSADLPDELVAPKTAALSEKLRTVFSVRDNEKQAIESAYNWSPGAPDFSENWKPQITWTDNREDWFGLTCPCWHLAEALPVDLCFEAEILDVKTGTIYTADPLIAVRGQARGGYISPRDARAFAKGREGFVTVKVTLKPARALALTDLRITKYYPEPITSGEVRMRITTPATRQAEAETKSKAK